MREQAASASWRLAQAFWGCGLWLLQFVMLPSLRELGFAPLLVQEVAAALRPSLLSFAAFCILLQMLILSRALGLAALLRDLRGQLLSLALLLTGVHFMLRAIWPAEQGLMLSYLAVGGCGLLLLLQPAPPSRAKRGG
ncbi:DUF4149 domain-containing protein [Stutzerimonas kirkiae]|uniref:DUF4149 domain-containing protein n=2 Tax=Stutzerimonas kirkiae TaxID=2211392 RepID=A0A4V2KD83_9GAMM|nr:DUF4149 domain-containing protein [Stutzerimonas kirkiae]TBU97905.1 DUF4149 domain-containing protein [Stutzerimonas kirkiae]TBV04579.1 DUF4149 domain-containing protein [Stutzerimonas kirkiae]TBV16083.1 DUF4149 domain-containing protein [Stutzerimonas kirkiae]